MNQLIFRSFKADGFWLECPPTAPLPFVKVSRTLTAFILIESDSSRKKQI